MSKTMKLIFGFFMTSILGGIIALTIYKKMEKPPAKVVIEKEADVGHFHMVNANTEKNGATLGFELAAEKSLNAVVHIKTETMVQQNINPMYRFFYGYSNQHNQQAIRSSGSGVIISSDGYIVTNNHVIDKTQKIEVTLNNKKTYKAEIVGTDPFTDLALLKIDADNLPYINYGNSNHLNVGEWVLAVGNPFNLTSTVTAGIVSAKGRDINILQNDPYTGAAAIESFIQTDAAVNPGNSGGALVNTAGELVGINTAIQSNTGSYSGYSFAVPVNIVKKVVLDLKEFGSVQRAFIGVTISNITEELAQEIGTNSLNGVFISGVAPNGSAGKAGIEPGDIIVKIGNKAVNNVPELQEQLSQFRPGDDVDIIINRNQKEKRIPVKLKNLEGNEKIIPGTTNKTLKLLGAKISPAEEKELENLRIDNGLKVREVYNGKLRSVGVKSGFIITKVNHVKVYSVKQLIEIINKAHQGVLLEGLYENGRKEFYGFGI